MRRLLTLFVVIVTIQGRGQCQTLDSVIQNLRNNEDLYNNYSIRIARTYKTPVVPLSFKETILFEQETTHTIRLGEKFAYSEKRDTTTLDGVQKSRFVKAGFDGTTYRVNWNDAFANVANEMHDYPGSFRPHAIFLRPWGNLRLSTYLRAGNALKSDPDAGSYTDFHYTPSSVSSLKKPDGTLFVVVQIDARRDNGRLVGRNVVHLNVEKNYLPESSDVIDPDDHNRLISKRKVTGYTQLDGLWYPSGFEITNYNPKGEVIAAHLNLVESLQPASKEPAEVYSQIPLNPKAPIYTIKGGKVIHKTEPAKEDRAAQHDGERRGLPSVVLELVSLCSSRRLP